MADKTSLVGNAACQAANQTPSQLVKPKEDSILLNWLRSELPDSNQDLFIQLYDRFDLFPRLPIEIRLTIWKATIPRRIIDQELIFMRFCIANRYPVTANVNRESRKETLKHYQTFHYIPFPLHLSQRPSRVVIGSNDILRTSRRAILSSIQDGLWTFNIVETLESFMEKFAYVQVLDYHWQWMDCEREMEEIKSHLVDDAAIRLLKNVTGMELRILQDDMYKHRALPHPDFELLEIVFNELSRFLLYALQHMAKDDPSKRWWKLVRASPTFVRKYLRLPAPLEGPLTMPC